MDNHQEQKSANKVYFVMNKTFQGWIRVSEDYASFDAAARALERLRRSYPFARLGGAKTN